MDNREFKYEIGGKTYVQKKLVLGQIRQLTKALEGLTLEDDISPVTLITTLADRLPGALAVVLTEEGRSPGDKDLPSLAGEIEFSIEPEKALKVVEDFFDCNPVRSIIKRLNQLSGKVKGGIEATGSPTPSASSPGETSARGT